MSFKIRYLFGFIFLFSGVFANAQFPDTAWIYTYGGPGQDFCKSIKATSDGGFILAGTTSSYGAGCSGIYLVKINSAFRSQWSKVIGGMDVEWGYSVENTLDGGYAISGYTNSSGAGGYDFYLVKTDAFGNTLWTKTYGGADWDFCYSLTQMSDSGFVLCGETYSFGNGMKDIYVVRTDKNGDTLWTRSYGGAQDDRGGSAITRGDTIFVIGTTNSFGSGGSDMYFMELNNNGDTLLTRLFGGAGDDIGNGIDTAAGHTVVFIGSTTSFPSPTGINTYVFELDTGGNVLWSHVHGGANDDIGNSITQAPNGDFYTVGNSNSSGSGGFGLHMMWLNSGGWWLSGPVFGGLYDEEGCGVAFRAAGGVVFAGTTPSYGMGQEDMYLVYLKNDSMVLNYTLQITNYGDSLSPLSVRNDFLQERNIVVYPNPFDQKACVRLGDSHFGQIGVKIYDAAGRMVREKRNLTGPEFFIERNDLAPGLYFLELSDKGNLVYRDKLIIN